MKLALQGLLSIVFVLLFHSYSFCQDEVKKECFLSTGIGLGQPGNKYAKPGKDVWVQLSYTIGKRLSLAVEFEGLGYTRKGMAFSNTWGVEDQPKVDNSFSLLLKYSLVTKRKVAFSVASGWSYNTRLSRYFYYDYSQTWGSQRTLETEFMQDYRIPLIAEVGYRVFRTVWVNARFRYNLQPENGNTCAIGIGASLKL